MRGVGDRKWSRVSSGTFIGKTSIQRVTNHCLIGAGEFHLNRVEKGATGSREIHDWGETCSGTCIRPPRGGLFHGTTECWFTANGGKCHICSLFGVGQL